MLLINGPVFVSAACGVKVGEELDDGGALEVGVAGKVNVAGDPPLRRAR